jgi:phosphotransferase system IIB component
MKRKRDEIDEIITSIEKITIGDKKYNLVNLLNNQKKIIYAIKNNFFSSRRIYSYGNEDKGETIDKVPNNEEHYYIKLTKNIDITFPINLSEIIDIIKFYEKSINNDSNKVRKIMFINIDDVRFDITYLCELRFFLKDNKDISKEHMQKIARNMFVIGLSDVVELEFCNNNDQKLYNQYVNMLSEKPKKQNFVEKYDRNKSSDFVQLTENKKSDNPNIYDI